MARDRSYATSINQWLSWATTKDGELARLTPIKEWSKLPGQKPSTFDTTRADATLDDDVTPDMIMTKGVGKSATSTCELTMPATDAVRTLILAIVGQELYFEVKTPSGSIIGWMGVLGYEESPKEKDESTFSIVIEVLYDLEFTPAA